MTDLGRFTLDPADDPTLARVLTELQDGPRESDELGVTPHTLRALRDAGLVTIDPDRWPDEFVPGNPMVARLPGDKRPWPGWKRWNI